jgi:mannose/fructose/N-acetylgalactosamine-specific phosphotransferase system component IID
MTQVMIPIFRSLGYSGEKLKDGYRRHLVFYNTHPYFGALIMGVMAAMEEAKRTMIPSPLKPSTISRLP